MFELGRNNYGALPINIPRALKPEGKKDCIFAVRVLARIRSRYFRELSKARRPRGGKDENAAGRGSGGILAGTF